MEFVIQMTNIKQTEEASEAPIPPENEQSEDASSPDTEKEIAITPSGETTTGSADSAEYFDLQ